MWSRKIRLCIFAAIMAITGVVAVTLYTAPQSPRAENGLVRVLLPVASADAQEMPRDDAASAPTVPAPAVATETVENPYGMGALWAAGDFVSRGTLIVLLIMSMGSWYILFTKLYEQYRFFKHARGVKGTFRNAGSVKQGLDGLVEGSPFHYIAEEGIQAAAQHELTRAGQIDRNSVVSISLQRALENVQARLQDGLSFLATVGSTAPFVGLFGTVWGIYHALTAIGIAGQASIDKVAGPVGEALIMTAMGLVVAVPAVMAYNWLVRRNKRAMEDLRAFGADLHLALMTESSGTADVVTPLRTPARARER